MKWSQGNIIAAISSPDNKRDINDPEIQEILEELEKKGLVCLKHEEDCYLEVLHD